MKALTCNEFTIGISAMVNKRVDLNKDINVCQDVEVILVMSGTGSNRGCKTKMCQTTTRFVPKLN
jgi:hypothetical protein